MQIPPYLIPFIICIEYQALLLIVIRVCENRKIDLFQGWISVLSMLVIPIIVLIVVTLFFENRDCLYTASCFISFGVAILIPVLGIRAAGSENGLKAEAICLFVVSVASLVLSFIPNPQLWMVELSQICSAASALSALVVLYMSFEKLH